MADYKIRAVGSEDKRFVQVEIPDESKGASELKWVEIDPEDGTILRNIQPRRFVEYDDTGKIIAVHNINYSELLETQGPEAFMAGKRGFEVVDKTLKNMDSNELMAKYKLTGGKLEKEVL